MASSKGIGDFVARACSLSRHVDQNLRRLQRLLGGRVTPFSTFRGYFVEEVTLGIARHAAAGRLDIDVVKLSTGEGVLAGVALAFRRDHVPDPVQVVLRRDREDVIVGIRRTLRVEGPGESQLLFPNELIPICMVACKMYIDATRLENVLAKVKNLYGQYSSCRFVVVADWDALGEGWHDNRGRILDSLVAPISEVVFLRGDEARRPSNDELQKESLAYPYLPKQLWNVYRLIQHAVKQW